MIEDKSADIEIIEVTARRVPDAVPAGRRGVAERAGRGRAG
jgi:hypothetical protein